MKTQISNQRYGVAFFLTILIVCCLQNFAYGINVADRTPQVRDAIVAAAGVDSPVEVTEAHLATITALDLASKNITTLKIGDFDGLTALQDLFLNNNQLTDLPAVLFMRHLKGTARIPTAFPVTVFNGLTSLRKLHLHNNQLTFLRAGVFSGLISLQDLYLHNNTVDPLEMTVSLEKVAEDAFRAVIFTGAPFDMRLPIRITNGSIVGGATALTIPQGGIESEILTVTQTPGTLVAVTVDIEALPEPPHDIAQHGGLHQGYVLVKSEVLPLVVLPNVAPVFSEGATATRTIAENTASNANIGTPVTATDANNDLLTYTLGGTDAAAFRIISYTGQLQTRAALDYETKDTYRVRVSVSDSNGGTDSINVTINVSDVNETPTNNAPVFTDGDTTTRAIAENTASGINIGAAVAATDQDGDTLTYSLGGTDAASFSIVNTTGQLQTRAALDYETKKTYSVTVSVSDGNGGTDSINVTINVTDVNETPTNNAPVFTDGTSTTRAIAENTASGQNIGAPVSATDADGDTLTYSLGGTDAASFSIVNTTGQLQTRAALDYETKKTYSVTVSVSDGNGGTDSINVTINVSDVNETPANNAPVFTDGTSTTRAIAENTASGQNIGTPVSATDADNDTLTYTLGGTDAASFSIVNTSGQLRTRAALDYETKNAYSVRVSVSDGNGGTDSINVTINVSDVNETPANNAPVFTDGTSTARSVAENTASGTNIGTPVSATDADNDTLTYTLGGTDAASFSIVNTSGQLRTRAALDYETKKTYTVTVSVSDGNGGTDSITVTINVTDVTELPSGITPVANRTPQVRDAIVAAVPGVNSANNVTAAHLAAITELSIQNKKITSLKSGDFSGLTGLKRLYLGINSISDISSLGSLTSLTLLSMYQNSINDVSPLANLTNLTSIAIGTNAISDISSLGTLTKLTILTVQNNSITDMSVVKKLTNLTGLSLSRNPISDISAVANLTKLTSFTMDNTSISNISAVENLTNLTGLEVGYNTITDISAVENLTKLTLLGLSENSITDISAIENLTKLEYLYLTGNPITDYAPVRRLKAAIDIIEGHQGLYLDIRIPAVPNNTAPIFTDGTSTTRSIAENTASGTSIGSAVAATDADTTDTLTYHLGGTDASSFSIVRTSGQLQTNAALDHETKNSYTVTIAVSDGKGGTDRITVTITVTDVAGAAPSVETPPMLPENTALLTNFPNPFNPETWIPYQLSKPAKVTLTIYNMRGVVVRELKLGLQPAGMYRSRSHAIHWDGRNMFGEKVATGVYFYTLTADDFNATRKLLIAK